MSLFLNEKDLKRYERTFNRAHLNRYKTMMTLIGALIYFHQTDFDVVHKEINNQLEKEVSVDVVALSQRLVELGFPVRTEDKPKDGQE